LRAHRQRTFADSTRVKFRALSTTEIRHYLAQINPLDKAGAYAIQDNGDLIVEKISGSYTNVDGLPLERLREEFAHWQQA
jgi:septum formation protein